jgi:catechol 2,3-dioxygenase-like lactoylglutathione lyase family enzyme
MPGGMGGAAAMPPGMYRPGMQGVVSAAVPVCYVRSLEPAREFYRLFGYGEQRSGGDDDATWSYLQCGEHTLLLACVQPPLIQVELPLLIYLYVDDLPAVCARLTDAGHPAELTGHPDHAPGGEARTVDPDGNTVLLGQRSGTRVRPPTEAARVSLLHQAADAISRRGGAPASCQVGLTGGRPCPEAAEVKLADPWGETVWACLAHADEALLEARSAFIAIEDDQGLGAWLRRRQPSA